MKAHNPLDLNLGPLEQHTSRTLSSGDPEEDFFGPFVRRFGPTEIDDGPYRCDIVTCMRITGFRSQEALDRHKRLFH